MTTLDPIPLGGRSRKRSAPLRPSERRNHPERYNPHKIQKRPDPGEGSRQRPSEEQSLPTRAAHPRKIQKRPDQVSIWEARANTLRERLRQEVVVYHNLKNLDLFTHPVMLVRFTEYYHNPNLKDLDQRVCELYLDLLDRKNETSPPLWPLDQKGNSYPDYLFAQVDLVVKLEREVKDAEARTLKSKVSSRKSRIVHSLLKAGYSRDPQMRLKQHQLDGVFFMNCLENRIRNKRDAISTGGVLAHEVGAGKTLQCYCLSVLDKVENRTEKGCTLVVASKSIVPQWKPEFARFFGAKNPFFRVGWADNKETHLYDGRVLKGLPSDDILNHHDLFVVHYELLTTLFKRCGLREKYRGIRMLEQWDRRAAENRVTAFLGPDHDMISDDRLSTVKGKQALSEAHEALWEQFLSGQVKLEDWLQVLNPIDPRRPELDFGRVEQFNLPVLLGYKWRRVIVDEAHVMRNPDSDCFTVLSALQADFRWCVSGTPQWHKDQDQWALFKFLKVNNLSPKKDFAKKYINTHKYQTVLQRIFHKVTAADLCKSSSSSSVPRETKTIAIANWPAETVLKDTTKDLPVCYVRYVWFDGFAHPEEIDNYRKLTGHATDVQKDFADDTGNTMVMMSILNNARIMCMGAAFKPKWFATPKLSKEDVMDLLQPKEEEEEEEEEEDDDFDPAVAALQPSTKFDAVFRYLEEIVRPDEKVIVFCEWKKPLRVIEHVCRQQNVNCIRIDGDSKDRQSILQTFKQDKHCRVLLSSYCISQGVDGLQVANHVLILNPWWAKNREMQALARAHRLGQKRPVHVVYFLLKNTVECSVRKVATTVGKQTAELTRSIFAELCKEPAFF